MRSHWERKMNPGPARNPRAIRPPATQEQLMKAFDLLADGTSKSEAARTVGVSIGALDDFPGWSPKESADWTLTSPKRVRTLGA